MSISAFEIAADILDPSENKWLYDPVGWANKYIEWPYGRGLTVYQADILDMLYAEKRVAARGPHGLGKTTLAAIAIIHFAITRDMSKLDWKIPTTASAWRQLTHFLWPEISKWSKKIKWDLLGVKPWTKRELLHLNLKLTFGEAFAVASNNSALIEGAHADHILYIFDEAKAIEDATFDAAEGAFSGAGDDTEMEAFALAISTPGEPYGRFYQIHKRDKGFEDWKAIHIKLDQAIKSKRISKDWAEQRKVQWGEQSAVYQNRVLGEFASSDEDSIIPLAWIEQANERWLEFQDNGDTLPILTSVGVDVARSGKDKTVLALRNENIISELRSYDFTLTTEVTGYATGVLEGNVSTSKAIVDVIGIGAGVFDSLHEKFKNRAIAFNAAAGTDNKDSSGELGFTNCRGAAWWNLRELLDPKNKQTNAVMLPPDDFLIGDLTAPKWRVMQGGKIQVESKDDLVKRLGRSTDHGDAVVMAFWEDSMTKRKEDYKKKLGAGFATGGGTKSWKM